MSDYKPVPVAAAKQLAVEYDKSMVVILAHDPVHELTHTTTYGRGAFDKENAAAVGAICAKAIGCDLSRRHDFEDFHQDYDAARAKQQAESLQRLASYAITCLTTNQPIWMKGLVERINQAAQTLGGNDHFEFRGDQIVRTPVPPPPAPDGATDGPAQS